MDETPLTPAEHNELIEIQRALREAFARDPEATRQAWKDAAHFPSQSGQVS